MSSSRSSNCFDTEKYFMAEPQTWDEFFHLITAPTTVHAGEEFKIVFGTENDAPYVVVLLMPAEKKIASAFQEIIVKVDEGIFTFTGTFDPEFDYEGLIELNFQLLLEYDQGQIELDTLTLRMKVKNEE